MRARCVLAIFVALALVVSIPTMTLGQYGSPAPNQAARQAPPQPKGGVATVIAVDQPDNCLRIRSGPGDQYDVIGCANMGDQLKITGVWTSNDWAQLADNGWVYGPEISTDLRPPRTAYSRTPTYVVSGKGVPDYDDWAYLPDYGYDTYWYGDVPIFFYNAAVWYWCHPSWWWHGLQAWWWQDGFHGRRHWDDRSFRNFAMTRGVNVAVAGRSNISALNRIGRTTRSASIASSNVSKFNVNRSNITSPNVSRFNANRSAITTNRSNGNAITTNRSNRNAITTNRSNRNVVTTNRSNRSVVTTNRPHTTHFNVNRSQLGFRSMGNMGRTFSNSRSMNMGSVGHFNAGVSHSSGAATRRR